MSIQAETFRNPFQMNATRRPIVAIYQDAGAYPPHNLIWMASIDCMSAIDEPESHEASASGFEVRGIEQGSLCTLQFNDRDSLVEALQSAGYAELDAFQVTVARIHGEASSEYLGKVCDVTPAPVCPAP